MTQTITEPDTIDIPIEPVAMPACPPLCNDSCDESVEAAGDAHHSTGFSTVTIVGGYRGEDVDLDVSASRTDENYQAGTPEVNLMPSRGGDGVVMSPAEARQVAALLLNAADRADPLPTGVMVTTAGRVRIGDEIETPDGWQQVNGLLMFPDADQAALFTPEKCDCDSDGYQYSMTTTVKVRRPVHGSCAIQFVEPIR